MSGVQALKVGQQVPCNKVLKEKLQETHIQDQSLLNLQCCKLQSPGLVLCPSYIPEEEGVNRHIPIQKNGMGTA